MQVIIQHDITKTYKTKKGFAVKLYDIIDDRVMGAVQLFDSVAYTWCAATWNLQGLNHNSNFDLVEIPNFSIDIFVQKKLLKDVYYFGKHIKVPLDTKYVYTNASSRVWASTTKPSFYNPTGSWWSCTEDTEVGMVKIGRASCRERG